jgi:hypothetical protein
MLPGSGVNKQRRAIIIKKLYKSIFIIALPSAFTSIYVSLLDKYIIK